MLPMSSKSIFIIGAILSFVAIIVLANRIEDGDRNAVSMYFFVFFIPALIFSLINTIYLRLLNKLKNKLVKIILSFLPIVILAFLNSIKNITLPFVDGELSFSTQVALIAFGFTNLIWGISLLKFNLKKI